MNFLSRVLSLPFALLCLLSVPAALFGGAYLALLLFPALSPAPLALAAIGMGALGFALAFVLLFAPAKLYFDNLESYRSAFSAFADYPVRLFGRR